MSKDPLFLAGCDRSALKEFGFISLTTHRGPGYFVGSYLCDKGVISSMIFPFIEYGFQIESTIGSMIVFSSPCNSLCFKSFFLVTLLQNF